jgi:acetyl esterase/lipase
VIGREGRAGRDWTCGGFWVSIRGSPFPTMRTLFHRPRFRSQARELVSATLLTAVLFRHTAEGAAGVSGSPAPEPRHPASILLWPEGAPGSEGKQNEKEVVTYKTWREINYISVTNVHQPSITPYLPAKRRATGAAVIVAPGGGHNNLAIDTEGYNVAQWLADHGVAAFVLKYRLAKAPGSTYAVEKESLADAQRAIRLVRSRAAGWNINPNAVGVMGFSAGGEIMGLAAMRSDAGNADATDPVEKLGCKPSFQALIYPGNTRAIMPDASSPPAFLVSASDDVAISDAVANVYLLFHQAKVPVEMHVFASGAHGFGLGTYCPMPPAAWPGLFITWLGDRGMLGKKG